MGRTGRCLELYRPGRVLPGAPGGSLLVFCLKFCQGGGEVGLGPGATAGVGKVLSWEITGAAVGSAGPAQLPGCLMVHKLFFIMV